jgi:hypothetical protein
MHALLGAAGDEVVGVVVVEACVLDPPHRRFKQLLWNRVNRLTIIISSSSLRLSTCSFMTDNKEDKANKAGEGLET